MITREDALKALQDLVQKRDTDEKAMEVLTYIKQLEAELQAYKDKLDGEVVAEFENKPDNGGLLGIMQGQYKMKLEGSKFYKVLVIKEQDND